MTPTATYIAEENCLQEISQMDKPERDYDEYEPYSDHFNYWMGEWREYDDHLATLRKIPCDPSCKGLWADGQKLVVGKDYGVHSICIGNGCYAGIDHPCVGCEKRAFPIVPVKSEDECTGIFPVQRLTNGSGHSNLTIITEEAIPDVYIGSLLLVPFVHGYKDPEKVKVLLDETGKPVATKLRTCIVVEYIFA